MSELQCVQSNHYHNKREPQSYQFKVLLHKGAEEEGERREEASNGHLLQGTETKPHLGHQREDGVLKERNHQSDQQSVDHPNLVRLDGEGKQAKDFDLGVHVRRLERPPTGHLPEQCPEERHRQEGEESRHKGTNVVDGLALKEEKGVKF